MILVDEVNVTALTRKSELNSFNRPAQVLFIIDGLGAPVKNNMVLFSRFLAGKVAIGVPTSMACSHRCRRFLFLKIQPRIKP